MSRLLEFILSEKRSIDEIKAMVRQGYAKIPLFEAFASLNNLSLSEHLRVNVKLMGLDYTDFHNAGAINIEERDMLGFTSLQSYILINDLYAVKYFLSLGAQMAEGDFGLIQNDTIRDFFNYRPGRNGQPSILEFCLKRRTADYLEKINALIVDENNSSEEDSSESETLSSESLNEEEKVGLTQLRNMALSLYNGRPRMVLNDNPLCLVAARGVHFSPGYFKTATIEQVKDTRHLPHTTYSQSTLFDAGYSADDSPSEDDEAIVQTHNDNTNFINQLKITADFKEKKIGAYRPPASRRNRDFENAYYHFMQMYINSYSTMFTLGAIRIDFGFNTFNNPVVSAAWKIEKGAMYGNGTRISASSRRDPHYRQFTGKPKHPNMGYLDLFVFDINYAKTNGFDRTLQCAAGKIDLNNLFRFEAEVIFNSMIPKRFHEHRHILTLPSFELPFTQNKPYYKRYGIISDLTYKKCKKNLFGNPKNSKQYNDIIQEISEKAGDAQALTIKKSLDCRLFRAEKPKVAVFDHGKRLETVPFTI